MTTTPTTPTTTAASTGPATDKLEPGVATLRPTERACLTCGIAVGVDADDSPPIVRLSQAPRPHPSPNASGGEWREREFVRCDECAELLSLAEATLDRHPAIRHAIGARSIGVYRLEVALAGLAALGQSRLAPRLTRSRTDVLRLMRLLTAPGGAARWSARFVPIATRGAKAGTCAARPWAHLDDPDAPVLVELRESFGKLLRERTERPRQFAPPAPGRGCAMCGVATVEALPSRQHLAWTAVTFKLASLGGPMSPHSVEGFVCRDCSAAMDRVGSAVPGWRAMTEAIVAHLEAPRRWSEPPELEGAVGWAALPGNPKPNARPWAHLALEELARVLEAPTATGGAK